MRVIPERDMVTSNETLLHKTLSKTFCRRLTEVKSVWLVISEAGNAVCGVAEIFTDLTSSFLFGGFHLSILFQSPGFDNYQFFSWIQKSDD